MASTAEHNRENDKAQRIHAGECLVVAKTYCASVIKDRGCLFHGPDLTVASDRANFFFGHTLDLEIFTHYFFSG